MKKSKIHPELKRMFAMGAVEFKDSQAGITIDGIEHHINAPRLYELVKENKIKKSKFHFNTMTLGQEMKGSLVGMANHILRVQSCDTSIPIVVSWEGSVYDGLHRVIRAMLEGKSWIWCYRLWIDPKERKKDTEQPLVLKKVTG